MVQILNQPPPKPIRGWISTFKVNHKGKKLGPYHYRCWKAGLRTYKEYVKPKDLDYYLAATQAHRDKRKIWASNTKKLNNYIDNYNYMYVIAKRAAKGIPIEQEHIDHMEKIGREGCHAQGRPLLRKKTFMDPFLTNLWIMCREDGIAFNPLLRAYQLKVPIEEIHVDLRESNDPKIEEQQMAAVHDAFLRMSWKELREAQT